MPQVHATAVGLSGSNDFAVRRRAVDTLRDVLQSPQVWDSARVFAIGVLISVGKLCADAAWSFIKRLFLARAVFRSKDDSYRWVLYHLSQLDAIKKTPRNVEVASRPTLVSAEENLDEDDGVSALDGEGPDKAAGVWLYPLPNEPISFQFEGRWIWAKRRRQLVGDSEWDETLELSFLTFSSRIIRRFVRHAREALEASERGKLGLYKLDRYNRWERAMGTSKRPAESLHLDAGLRERLLDDARNFLSRATREAYAERGVPWRRGWLLWGPPGNGKSSMVTVLASTLSLPIYHISLAGRGVDDASLSELMRDVPSRSIVLIEDIDAALVSQLNRAEGDSKSGSVSLAALLNIIDGVGAPEGRLLIATTNHKERLDAALLRPGRIDVEVQLLNATKAQAADLFCSWFRRTVPLAADADEGAVAEKGATMATTTTREELRRDAQAFVDAIPERRFSVAALQGFLLSCPENEGPRGAVSRIRDWVEGQGEEHGGRVQA